MQVLKVRGSAREFSCEPLSRQLLSNLLWAATGVNRLASGKRTAPSARDWREIDVYVVIAEGAYLYDAQTHVLLPVAAGDLRQLTGEQEFVSTVPVNFVYVANLDRMIDAGVDRQALYSGTDTGFIAQNVYLFCASFDLACVVRGSIDRSAISTALQLNKHQRVILAQSVGYPAK
ncbi:SagB/ThcOx family dehydrogenase [Formivibrio citricus]|nr:SagB/ThcOx family dehydrogenase [Formivibrio citricus]